MRTNVSEIAGVVFHERILFSRITLHCGMSVQGGTVTLSGVPPGGNRGGSNEHTFDPLRGFSESWSAPAKVGWMMASRKAPCPEEAAKRPSQRAYDGPANASTLRARRRACGRLPGVVRWAA
jgi:hypothetical protein